MYQIKNARAGRLFFLIKPIVLRRYRCRRRRRCLSYVVSFQGAFKGTASVIKKFHVRVHGHTVYRSSNGACFHFSET